MSRRSFLFLQGVCSPFFPRLADQLAADGNRIYRINFNGGDAAYWGRRPAWSFRGSVEGLSNFLAGKCRAHGITDFVLFGDQRPIHRTAIGFAQRESIRVHAFEEGYVRPNWITLERGGSNAASALPRDPAWYLKANATLPDADGGAGPGPSFAARALHDMAYHAANACNFVAYPGYRTHRPFISAIEYAGWARRYAFFPWWLRRDAALIEKLVAARTPYYFLPLQLNGDFQVTHHSPFGHMATMLEHVVKSFATHAPTGSRLVIKNHSLDTGLFDYVGLIRRLSDECGISNRIDYVETGHLPTLLEHALGVVTVNSTVGLSALHHLRPTKVLGKAIYDLPGLTCQRTLEEFWSNPQPPDPGLYWAFRNVVIHTTQISGNFFTSAGIDAVLAGCDRLLASRSRLEQLLERFPAGGACERRQAS